jgi:hypothetical protein
MNGDWLGKVAGVLRGVRTPLSLGGLAIIVLCVVYNRVLGLGIFSTINASQTSNLLTTMVGYVFWLALIAVVLGGIGYLIRPGPAQGGGGRTNGARRRNSGG